MAQVEGSLARKLDFGDGKPGRSVPAPSGRPLTLRLAPARHVRGPQKYQVLEARRRHAQIKARRLLDLMDTQERSR